jgi:DNA-binding NarL/FixJ family response regulator
MEGCSAVMDTIRVLIVDDHAPFRAGLHALLRSESDMEMVEEAATGEEAIRYAATLQPDGILMDLHMPGVNGIEATQTIVATSPHISILVLTMIEDDDSVFAALHAGARDYLLKGALKADIVRAIRGVSHGEAIFGPTIAIRLMSYFATLAPPAPSPPVQTFPELTEISGHRATHEQTN